MKGKHREAKYKLGQISKKRSKIYIYPIFILILLSFKTTFSELDYFVAKKKNQVNSSEPDEWKK